MEILRAVDRAAVPWKNGAGVTREVCADIEADGFDFGWRLSTADVCSNGPFSRFSGVDRHLAVLEGRMRLKIDQEHPIELAASSPPKSFVGEAETSAAVLEPVVDLNLMIRRDSYRGALERKRIERAIEVGDQDSTLVIFAIEAVGVSGSKLARWDAVRLERGETAVIEPTTKQVQVIIARIWPIRPVGGGEYGDVSVASRDVAAALLFVGKRKPEG